MKNEIWKVVDGFGGRYHVSSLGSVKSTFRGVEKLLRQGDCSKTGYYSVHLYQNGKRSAFNTHRLVALAFIEKPPGTSVVNHKNGDRRNNTIDNLEWLSHAQNIRHAYTHLGKKGYERSGQRNPNAKIQDPIILRAIVKMKESGIAAKRIAEWFTVHKSSIDRICKIADAAKQQCFYSGNELRHCVTLFLSACFSRSETTTLLYSAACFGDRL